MLEDVLRSRPAQIAEVVAELEAIVKALPPGDGVAAFTTLYLAVTQAVGETVRTGTFEDEPFLRSLDVAFANLYLDALRRFFLAEGPVPSAWKVLCEARGRRGILPLQFALAGMNAHINGDLPAALVATFEARGVEPRRASPQHRDFLRVNTVLEQTEERVKAGFVRGALADVDKELGRVDDVVAMWKVAEARNAAWTNAETLWALRGSPGLRAQFLRTLDHMVGFAGRGLLRPVAVLR